MGKKGKTLWRKTISTDDIDEAREKETRQDRSGPAVDTVPDEQLFFIDTEQDKATVDAVSKGRKLRSSRKEPRLLKCQTILNAAHSAKAVNPSASKPKQVKGPAFKRPATKQHSALQVRAIGNAVDSSQEVDLWQNDAPKSSVAPKRNTGKGHMKAVEIDAPGCSFNPDLEQHQDTVAEAVAAEMSKIYAKEHEPKMKRIFNHMPDMTELDALLDDGAEEEEDDARLLGSTEVPQADNIVARQPKEKKTEAVRNKQKRAREVEEQLRQKQALKKQRRDLDGLKAIQAELVQQQELQEALAARKAVIKADKAASEPPRLGKHKFEPPSVQVLLSEEIDGSLRRLKAAPMLTKDRFKALQKRGEIEPRVRIEPHMRRKRATYQTGDRAEKIHAGHEEVKEMIKATASAQTPKLKKKRK